MRHGRGSWTDNSDGVKHARNKQKQLLFSSQNIGEGPKPISAWWHGSPRKSSSLPVEVPHGQRAWQRQRALPWHLSPSCWAVDAATRSPLHMAACRWPRANIGRWLYYLWSLFIFWCPNIYISFFSVANSLVGRGKPFLLLKRLSFISGCQVQLKRLTTVSSARLAKSQPKSTASFWPWLHCFQGRSSWLFLKGFSSHELAASLNCTLDWCLLHCCLFLP